MEKHLQRFIVCECCGRKVRDYSYLPQSPVYQKMLAECLCYDCAYWDMMSKDKERNLVMIDGYLYDLQPYCSPEPHIQHGMDGKECYILKSDGTPVFSNDVWRIGTIPWRFQERFAEGWWITPVAYKVLKKRKTPCRNKTCMDRYRCCFYEWWTEFKKPSKWNPPLNWVAGSEGCRSFLNILWIKNYDYDIRKLIQNSFKNI